MTHVHLSLTIADNADVLPAVSSASARIVFADPPYNTGNPREYVDSFEPSLWCKNMGFLIREAYRIVRDDGVFVATIGDKALGDLLTLGDEVFGREQRIALIPWIDRGHGGSRFTTGGTDFMIVWAKDRRKAKKWRVPPEGLTEFLMVTRRTFEDTGSDTEAGTAQRAWARAHPEYPWARNWDRSINGSPARPAPLTSRSTQYDYAVTSPSGVVYRPEKGWRCPQRTFEDLDARGLIIWDRGFPRHMKILDETYTVAPKPVIERDRRIATKYVESLIGPGRFASPKDHNVLAYWFSLMSDPGDIVIDTYGGSGSVAEACAVIGCHCLTIERDLADVVIDRHKAIEKIYDVSISIEW